MVLQLLDGLPAGPVMAKVPRIIKVPEGEVWVETENPLGQMGYYVVSKGATGPFRVKIRSASFSNVSILPWLLQGVYVPDVITILGSLYFILGDIDRVSSYAERSQVTVRSARCGAERHEPRARRSAGAPRRRSRPSWSSPSSRWVRSSSGTRSC